MKGLGRIFLRVKSYQRNLILSIMSNVFLSLFTVVSIPLLIPFFQILFERIQALPVLPSSYKDINGWTKYYISDMILTFGKPTTLTFVCLALIIVFLLKNVFRYLALYFIAPLRNGIIYDLRKELYQKYLDLPLSFYSNERKGALISGFTNDVQEVEWSILNVIETVFKSPIIMIGSVMFMLFISPALTLFVFVLIIFSGIIIGRVVSNLRDNSVNVQDALADMTSRIEETLGGIRIIKSFNAERYQASRFETENRFFRQLLTKAVNKRDLAAPVSEFLGVAVVVILMWYGSNLVFKNELAPETFFAFVFAFYQIIDPAKSFASAYFNIQKGMAAMDRIDRILLTDSQIIDNTGALPKSSFTDHIKLDHVSFKYESSSMWALDDVSLDIPKGKVIALVGSSGAGKSTIADLLPRFYDPSIGSLKMDNLDFRDIKIEDLRSLFGIVSQDAILFNDTIAGNISFGHEDVTDQQIIDAAKIANAHDFVSAMPEGYLTNIGDRGIKLSGGQRQRLTIARAILRNPPILILDEATSALDSESEKLVQDAIANVMRGRTSIVIAHRLATIQDADFIVVLENGKIVEQGHHDTLIAQNGAYQRFVQMQKFD
jgi:ABC-type multidrug transport system fused ATPase/permease subunit